MPGGSPIAVGSGLSGSRILLAAKQSGKILSLRLEIERLQAIGFRVNPRLLTAVLRRAGE